MASSSNAHNDSNRDGDRTKANYDCQACQENQAACDQQRPYCDRCQQLGRNCVYSPMTAAGRPGVTHLMASFDKLDGSVRQLLAHMSEKHPVPLYQDFSSLSDFSRRFESPKTSTSSHNTPNTPTLYQNLTAPHKILRWPFVLEHVKKHTLARAEDLVSIQSEGTPWFLRKEFAKHDRSLPWTSVIPKQLSETRMEEYPWESTFTFPTLDRSRVHDLLLGYFRAFHAFTPFLDGETFVDVAMRKLFQDGCAEGDPTALLIFSVLALGQVAVEGASGLPKINADGKLSGWRGGSVEIPPGLGFFTEARRRMPLTSQNLDIKNVKVLLLHAIYYGTCGRYMEYWQHVQRASMSCQTIIHCAGFDWSSVEGDMVKRVYWTCFSNEVFFHRDLDMPRTSISDLEDWIQLPSFQRMITGNEPLLSSLELQEEYFLAFVSMSRLADRVNKFLHNAGQSNNTLLESYAGPTNLVLHELSRQLASWRSLLPRRLRWFDGEIEATDSLRGASQTAPSCGAPRALDGLEASVSSDMMMVAIQLRARFYCTQFQILRPYIFKALHFPALTLRDDLNNCALALKAACYLSSALRAMTYRKRHIVHQYTWTQSALSIMTLFKAMEESPTLRPIIKENVSEEMWGHTLYCMQEWIEDMEQADGVAEWANSALRASVV